MGVVDIGVDVYCRKVLAVRQGIHLFIVAGTLTIVIVIMRIDKLVHRHVVFFGKAITSKRQTAVYIIKIFSVAGTERVTLNGAVAVGATSGSVAREWVTSMENAPSSARSRPSPNASA